MCNPRLYYHVEERPGVRGEPVYTVYCTSRGLPVTTFDSRAEAEDWIDRQDS